MYRVVVNTAIFFGAASAAAHAGPDQLAHLLPAESDEAARQQNYLLD